MITRHQHVEGACDELEVISKPEVRLIDELVVYWEQKRAGRIAPRRADIDPSELTPHIPHIFMLDVIGDGVDFRYRLIGMRIVEDMGRDSTGHMLSDLYRDKPKAFDKLRTLFRLSVTEKCPIFSRGRVFWLPGEDYRCFAGGYVPLSDDGVNVNIVLAELFISYPHRGDW